VEQQPVETTLYSLADSPPGPGSRRIGGDRHLTLFRVGSLILGEQRELCLIKNISAGGMMIRAYCDIRSAARVSVELKCGESVAGTVAWVNGENVGIEFDQPIDVVALLTASMEGPRPRMPRIEVSSLAWIRQGAQNYRVQACDVSQGGIKIATSADLAVNAEVIVTLAGIEPQSGTIRWSDAGNYGITFNRLLSLPLLVGWIRGHRDRLLAAS
jgi:hypothetical protein